MTSATSTFEPTRVTLRDRLQTGVLVGDGAMGTRLRSYLPPGSDQPLELMNLQQPDLVRQIHQEYIAAGSDVITTNTFGASALRLRTQGREEDLDLINRRAVDLAREAASAAGRQVFVFGSVGPLDTLRYDADVIRVEAIEAEFVKQVESLAGAGVDAISIETMDEYREAVAATRAALRSGLPVITHLVSEDGISLGDHVDLYRAVRSLEDLGVAAIGLNCRVGPDRMLASARRVARYASRRLSLQPNAGSLVVDSYGRMQVKGEPTAFASFARACADLPVALVGGCCHTTPEHIRAIRIGLSQPKSAVPAEPLEARTKTGPRPASGLARRLAAGKFVLCVEIDPPTNEEVEADPGILSYKVDGARYLEERCGVDLITVADHTMGRPWLDGLPFAETLRPHLRSSEILLHYSCRNKAETDITGNFASFKLYDYRNILVITGDPPRSDECFYQYSSHQLIKRLREEHGDYFFFSCSFDHNRGRAREGDGGIDAELKRLRRKIDSGAQLALTQPFYSAERVMRLREKTMDAGAPVFPGIMPILSPQHAATVNQFPGIVVPEEVIARLRSAGDDRQARARISIEQSIEVARAVRDAGFPGIYLITSFNRFDIIKEILSAIE